MSESITAFYTVLSGYLVFILGQITINFLLNPIKCQKETIGEIQDAVIYYANVFSSMMNKDTQNEAAEKFRKLATKLVSTTRVIPFYPQLQSIFGLPSLKNIESAHHSLIGLSNGVGHERDTDKVMKNLKKELNLLFENE